MIRDMLGSHLFRLQSAQMLLPSLFANALIASWLLFDTGFLDIALDQGVVEGYGQDKSSRSRYKKSGLECTLHRAETRLR